MSELSPARLAANRANAQHSTGPKTPEGKAISALNSLVHGLRAETVVLPNEDAEVFEALCADLADEHQPQTVTEQRLIDTMAVAQWAVDRARRQELAVLTRRRNEAVAQCDPADEAARAAAGELALFDDSKEGALRLRYMTAQDNTYSRAFRNLMSLRRLRLREEKAAETSRRRQERDEKAAAKRSAPSEAKAPSITATPAPSEPIPAPFLLPPTPLEPSRLGRGAPASSALPLYMIPPRRADQALAVPVRV